MEVKETIAAIKETIATIEEAWREAYPVGVKAGMERVIEWVEMNANIYGISISRENWEAQVREWRRLDA